ncbi:MAG: EamA family transporter [Candidatus Omnitrophica bacterium]|nr:EamA family transporter [Candidatus Omnitrophota bacterium]
MGYLIWSILAALIWGIVPLIEKIGLAKIDPLVGLFYRCLGVLIGITALGIFFLKPQEIKSVDLRSAVLIVTAGIFASVIAQICFYNGLKLGEVSKVVPIAGSFPLISFILGVFFLGESLNPVKLVGVSLIIAGIWALKIS